MGKGMRLRDATGLPLQMSNRRLRRRFNLVLAAFHADPDVLAHNAGQQSAHHSSGPSGIRRGEGLAAQCVRPETRITQFVLPHVATFVRRQRGGEIRLPPSLL